MVPFVTRKKIITFFLISLFLFGIASILFHNVIILEITNYENGSTLYRKQVPPGYSFATLIRHSVHLTPVYEYYRIDENGRIILESTKLQDLGWGVPSTFTEPCRFEGGFLIIEGFKKSLDYIPFRVSYIAQPHLLLDGGKRNVDLKCVVNDEERIDISADKVPLWKVLIRGEVDVLPK